MKLIEIFRAGTRKDGNGQLVTITSDDLKAIAQNYNPEFHEAPLVIGHPKNDNPAYGWVDSLVADGNVLKAAPKQVDAEFAELVEAGKYKKISAAFYTPAAAANPKQGAFYLRHVGFLGAMPPAVKGLRNPEFNDGEHDVVEFTEEFVHEGPSGDQATAQERNHPEATTNEPNQYTRETMEKEFNELKTENARLQAQLAAQEKAKTEAENAQFAESLIAEGKLTPALKDSALCLLNAQMDTVEFTENDFKTQLKGFMSALPKVISTDEVATKDAAEAAEGESLEYAEGTDPSSIDADKKIRQYMSEHAVDYTTAFNQLYK